MRVFPQSRTGKWAAALTLVFLLLIAIFFVFMALGIVTFDEGHWWDITVGIAAPLELIAFVLSCLAIRKREDRSVLEYLAFVIGLCVILFLLTHSLYIHD